MKCFRVSATIGGITQWCLVNAENQQGAFDRAVSSGAAHLLLEASVAIPPKTCRYDCEVREATQDEQRGPGAQWNRNSAEHGCICFHRY